MNQLTSVIHDTKTNSVEATWVNEITPAILVPESIAPDAVDADGNVVPGIVTPAHTIPAVQVPIKCHSYADVQMGMFRADVLALGGNIAEHEAMIATVEEGIVPYVAAVAPPEQIIAQLWQAAHDYEYAQVSGSAIGLLAIGVMQSLPKCLAVQNWIKSIWTLYYTRKAILTPDYDFSSVGACPYTVPDLMAELWL